MHIPVMYKIYRRSCDFSTISARVSPNRWMDCGGRSGFATSTQQDPPSHKAMAGQGVLKVYQQTLFFTSCPQRSEGAVISKRHVCRPSEAKGQLSRSGTFAAPRYTTAGLICKRTVRLVCYRRMERGARSKFYGEYGGGVYYVLDPDGTAVRQEIARDTPPSVRCFTKNKTITKKWICFYLNNSILIYHIFT